MRRESRLRHRSEGGLLLGPGQVRRTASTRTSAAETAPNLKRISAARRKLGPERGPADRAACTTRRRKRRQDPLALITDRILLEAAAATTRRRRQSSRWIARLAPGPRRLPAPAPASSARRLLVELPPPRARRAPFGSSCRLSSRNQGRSSRIHPRCRILFLASRRAGAVSGPSRGWSCLLLSGRGEAAETSSSSSSSWRHA
jgi:hypothetical protein